MINFDYNYRLNNFLKKIKKMKLKKVEQLENEIDEIQKMKLDKFLTNCLLVFEGFFSLIFVPQNIKTVINYNPIHRSAIVIFNKPLI